MAMKEMMFTLEDIKKLLEIDERIDRGLENRTIDNKDINTLLEGVKSKHLEILEKEKQLKKVKMHLEKIIGKIENLQRRNNSD